MACSLRHPALDACRRRGALLPGFRARGFGGRPARSTGDVGDILLGLAARPYNLHLATADKNVSGDVGIPAGAALNRVLALDPLLRDPGSAFPGGGNAGGSPPLEAAIPADPVS